MTELILSRLSGVMRLFNTSKSCSVSAVCSMISSLLKSRKSLRLFRAVAISSFLLFSVARRVLFSFAKVLRVFATLIKLGSAEPMSDKEFRSGSEPLISLNSFVNLEMFSLL